LESLDIAGNSFTEVPSVVVAFRRLRTLVVVQGSLGTLGSTSAVATWLRSRPEVLQLKLFQVSQRRAQVGGQRVTRHCIK
jgi:hypothetical protein